MRYLHISLFGFVKYRGLNPVVPWVVLGVYLVLLVILAGIAVRWRGGAGLALATGLLLFAAEPFTTLNGGCEVGTAAGVFPTIPRVAVDGTAILLESWNGSCTAYLNSLVEGFGALWIAGGLWFDSLPDRTLDRWTAVVERYWPS